MTKKRVHDQPKQPAKLPQVFQPETTKCRIRQCLKQHKGKCGLEGFLDILPGDRSNNRNCIELMVIKGELLQDGIWVTFAPVPLSIGESGALILPGEKKNVKQFGLWNEETGENNPLRFSNTNKKK